MNFKVISPYQPAGDQPQAIAQLTKTVMAHEPHQTLLGVTGSGKTFTMAKLIEATQKPTLVIAHNKTLAAQLYQELRDFLPNNAVSYFVSYYDYYQPEAYIASTDTYIEKESTVNDEIDKLRLSTTTNLLTRPDCVVVASVSCIYNLGSPVEYGKNILRIIAGQKISRETLLKMMMKLQYEASPYELKRGTFRLRGDIIQLWPAYSDFALAIDTLDDEITSIREFEAISGEYSTQPTLGYKEGNRYVYTIYPAKHYTVNPKTQDESIKEIEIDLAARVTDLETSGKKIEAFRLKQKVNYDLEQIKEFGFCNGVENYSRYFDGRAPGDPPFTLLQYMQENVKLFDADSFLTIVDESHITMPQVRGMYFGDQARKQNLIQYGFRLPSALDNRPLQFEEFLAENQQFVYVSATPNDWEMEKSGPQNVAEQLVRPTGLIDPEVQIRPSEGQIPDLIKEIAARKLLGERVIVTVLTKKMAETLADYLNDADRMRALIPAPAELPKVAYLHSDIVTLERSDILADLRAGVYDVIIGINLLREGLDLPEVSLVAILDADKEGFLRSRTSLIQTIGRAARHLNGLAILYADKITGSMQAAIDETGRRRTHQISYNIENNITPHSITKGIRERMLEKETEKADEFSDTFYTKVGRAGKLSRREKADPTGKKKKPLFLKLDNKEIIDLNNFDPQSYAPADKKRLISRMTRQMRQAANEMDYEFAAIIRDKMESLQ